MADSLYDINQAWLSLLDEVREYASEHDGEISNELSIRLDAMEMTRDVKIENCLRYYKNENATAEMLDKEIEALHKRAKTHTNNAAWCKQYLAAIVNPKEKLEYAIGKISWRESTSANILDATKLPTEYQRVIPERREPDKIAIKEALKKGVEVPGAELIVSQNIQLK